MQTGQTQSIGHHLRGLRGDDTVHGPPVTLTVLGLLRVVQVTVDVGGKAPPVGVGLTQGTRAYGHTVLPVGDFD